MISVKTCTRIAALAAIALSPFMMFSSPAARASEAVPLQSGGVVKCCAGNPPETCVKLFHGDSCDGDKAPAWCPSEDSPPSRCTYVE